jgi:hypothetical protein
MSGSPPWLEWTTRWALLKVQFVFPNATLEPCSLEGILRRVLTANVAWLYSAPKAFAWAMAARSRAHELDVRA